MANVINAAWSSSVCDHDLVEINGSSGQQNALPDSYLTSLDKKRCFSCTIEDQEPCKASWTSQTIIETCSGQPTVPQGSMSIIQPLTTEVVRV